MGIKKKHALFFEKENNSYKQNCSFFSFIFLANIIADFKSDLDLDASWSVFPIIVFLTLPFINKKGLTNISRATLQIVFNLSTVLYLGIFGKTYEFQSFF
jgi:hypothetical protein